MIKKMVKLIGIDLNQDYLYNRLGHEQYLNIEEVENIKLLAEKTIKYYKENNITNSTIKAWNKEAVSEYIKESKQSTSASNAANKNQKTYLMRDVNTGFIKIGKSKSPKVRERTLQSEKPTIKLIAICDEDIESKLHSDFSRHRVRGEWFDFNDNALLYIVDIYNFKLV